MFRFFNRQKDRKIKFTNLMFLGYFTVVGIGFLASHTDAYYRELDEARIEMHVGIWTEEETEDKEALEKEEISTTEDRRD